MLVEEKKKIPRRTTKKKAYVAALKKEIVFLAYKSKLPVHKMSRHVNIIRFSTRGNPRRYSVELPSPVGQFQQHMLDSISGRHIQFRPRRNTMSAPQAPPDLLNMLDQLTDNTETQPNIKDTIPVYKAEGDLPVCTICQEAIKKDQNFRRLPCSVTTNHCFHQECIDPWLANNTTCPNCRSNLLE